MSSSKKLTCKGTLRQVFIRVYRVEIKLVMLAHIFDPALWTVAPPTLPVVQLHPPPPRAKVQYIQGGGRWWGCWVLLETIFCICFTLCIWPDSELTPPLTKTYMRGGGLGQINICRKVPLQVYFLEHFALMSIKLTSPWFCVIGSECNNWYRGPTELVQHVAYRWCSVHIGARALLVI
jgi:hypothetical protein